MNNTYKRFLLVLILFVVTASSFAEKVYLSGFYKIGNVPGARHKSIQQAVTELIGDSTEVIGRVTFDIYPGTYNERVILKPFNGASAKNFVIFRSYTGDANDVVIKDEGSNTQTDNAVIRSEGATFITFQDVTIHNSRNITSGADWAACVWLTYSRGVQRPSEYINFKRCVFKLDDNFDMMNGNAWGIFSSDIINPSIGANCANFCSFENNTFTGGFYGIKLLGLSNAVGKGNKIMGNKFYKVYNPININFNDVPQITGNYMDVRTDYVSGNVGGIIIFNSKGNFNIANNVILNYGQFGIFFNSVAGGVRSYVYNNAIGGIVRPTFSRGIHVINSRNIQFYYNSINYTGPANGVNAAMAVENSADLPATKISIKNNIFCASSGAYSCRIENMSSIDSMNYNDYWSSVPANLAYIGGGRNSLAAIQAATPGKNGQSMNVNPNFPSTTNLKTKNDLLIEKASPLLFVINDFENHPRDPETPDIGADEVIKSNVDAKVHGLDKNFIPKEGDNYLPVVIKNDGLISLKDSVIKLAYQIDGGAWSPDETFTLSSAMSVSYGKQTFVLQNKWTILTPQPYTLKIRITPPPIKNDSNQNNDIIEIPICVGLSGVYTVGGAAGPKNYPDLAAVAATAFQCGCGAPTTFNIRTGTYTNVQFSVPALKGTSPVNTLTFQAETGNAADVILTNASPTTVSNHFIVRADGIDYATFKNLTLKNTTASANATGFYITNSADNLTIENCVVEVPNATGVEKKYGILAGFKNTTTLDSSGRNGDNLLIQNCSIKGGRMGIQYLGLLDQRSNGIQIINNQIDSAHFIGIFTKDVNVTSISKNKIHMKTAADNLSEGIRIYNSKSNGLVNANRVYMAGARGINLNLVEGLDFLMLSNNMIAGGFKTPGNGAGIFLNEANKINVYNNSVYYDKVPVTLPTLSSALFISSAANLNLLNNIFYNPAGGYAVYSAAPNAFRTSNYNVYYTDSDPATGLFAFWQGNQSDLPALRATLGSTFEANSKEITPNFVSLTDLHTTNTLLDNEGKYSPLLTTDYDGEARNPTGCDIGADEYINVAVDMALIGIEPIVFSAGPNTIKVTISNQGANNLNGTPVMLSYNAGSGWSVPEPFTPTALGSPYGTEVYTFTAPFIAAPGSTYNFVVKVVPPAGDALTVNDSIARVICVGLKEGVYTIDSLGSGTSNFLSFSDAANALSCGITGPVLFNVAPGTYNDRFTIKNPKNTSPINTITFKGVGAPGSIIIHHDSDQMDDVSQNVIKLDRVKYITFDNLKIVNKDDSNIGGAAGIQLTSASEYVTVQNCVIEMSPSVIAPFSSIGIVVSDSANMLVGAVGASHCTFVNNKITGGTVGIQISGDDQYNRNIDFTIKGDSIINASIAGIISSNTDMKLIDSNVVAMRPGMTASEGIRILINRDDMTISRNKVYNAGTNGLVLNDLAPLNNINIVNNMIGGGFKNGVAGTVVNLDKVLNANFYYNSLNFDGDAQTSVGMKIDAESQKIRMLNNSVYNQSKGFSIVIDNAASIDTSENNNFGNRGITLARMGAVEYANIEEFKTGSGKDESSISADPDYFLTTDLRTTSTFLDQAGIPIPGITTDIFDTVRHRIAPDIGAFEFVIKGDAEIASIISPTATDVYPNVVEITVTINNPGLSKLTGLPVRYTCYNSSNDTIAVVDEILKTPLLPGESFDYTFDSLLTPPLTGIYTLCVQTLLADDMIPANDTDCVDFFSSSSDIVNGKVESIISPTFEVKERTEVKALLKNVGTVPFDTVIATYQIADQTGTIIYTTVSEMFIINPPVDPGEVKTIAFSDSIDCDKGLRTIIVILETQEDMENDVDITNNTTSKIIANFPACGLAPVGIGINHADFVISAPWPNPTKDEMNLDLDLPESGDVRIVVYDLLGKVMYEETKNNMAQGYNQMNVKLNHIAAGVYYTSIVYKDQVKTYRLMINNK